MNYCIIFRSKTTVLLLLKYCSLVPLPRLVISMGPGLWCALLYILVSIHGAETNPTLTDSHSHHCCAVNKRCFMEENTHYLQEKVPSTLLLVIYLCLDLTAAWTLLFLSFSSEYSIIQVFCNTYNLLTASLSTSFA